MPAPRPNYTDEQIKWRDGVLQELEDAGAVTYPFILLDPKTQTIYMSSEAAKLLELENNPLTFFGHSVTLDEAKQTAKIDRYTRKLKNE